MDPSDMIRLPALGRQHLLAEFTGLKQVCPDGVFLSLTPGDPSVWTGVIFVRKGPYANAILRFNLSFPETYPSTLPLVTFSTDIFHPLITPLTTHVYHSPSASPTSSSSSSSAPSEPSPSAAGGLPPGGFSLRHGLPTGRDGSGAVVHDVLRYVARAFDDEAVLDAVPLQAAGNPGAWHAWRARQRQRRGEKAEPAGAGRKPGEWSWEGVWEERVRRGVQASQSEAVLFGGAATGAAAAEGDDVINFLNMDEAEVESVKDNLLRTLGVTR